MANQLTKIRFPLDPEDWHGHGGEYVWAEPIGEASSKTFAGYDQMRSSARIQLADLAREKALCGIQAGDLFDVAGNHGAPITCLATAASETAIYARSITHQIDFKFDRKKPVRAEEWTTRLVGSSDPWRRCHTTSTRPL